MTTIPNTGERILLEVETPLMIARHLSAYRFAVPYAKGLSVLDIGCGQGYGSVLLAEGARHVTGIDYNADTIAYARQRYRRENLQFLALDIKELSTLPGPYDLVCSFQVIEHIRDTASFLQNVKRLLSSEGVCICSTPNRHDASPGQTQPSNRFHVKEYDALDYEALFREHFHDVRFFGLYRGRRLRFYRRLKKSGLCNFLPARCNPVTRFFENVSHEDFIISGDDIGSALDFFAVCKMPFLGDL